MGVTVGVTVGVVVLVGVGVGVGQISEIQIPPLLIKRLGFGVINWKQLVMV